MTLLTTFHLYHGHDRWDREQGLGSLTVNRFCVERPCALDKARVIEEKPRLLCKRGFLLSILCIIKITIHNI